MARKNVFELGRRRGRCGIEKGLPGNVRLPLPDSSNGAELSGSGRAWQELINRVKEFLFRPAFRADPVIGQIGKGGARIDLVVIVAFGRVIDVAAGAFHFLHSVSPWFKMMGSALFRSKRCLAGARSQPRVSDNKVSLYPYFTVETRKSGIWALVLKIYRERV